ncbi:MAG: hypothetical protein ACE5H1_03900 [Thermodesulfobacteriota bacterium]
MNSSDQYHCRCFKISPQDIELCESKLREIGFENQIGGEEDHGQAFGLVGRVEEVLQIHFKVMPDGLIEGEMEPPTAYPGAHTNPEHSYSAHGQIAQILQQINIPYYLVGHVPETCLRPIIKKPNKPTHAWVWAALLAIGIIGAAALYKASKDEKDEDDEDDVEEDDDEED